MRNYLKQRIWAYTASVFSFVKRNAAKFSIAGIVAVIGLLQALGVWQPIITWGGENLPIWGRFLINPWAAPMFVWLIIFLFLHALSYYAARDHWYLGKVAGEFYDDFKSGLSNWEYKGDWKIEIEGNKPLLSVRSSDIGGFTKKGFNWTDYEFSFETKVIKEASGWIIRANGNGFFMVQLQIINNTARLRPHFHKEDGGAAIWFPDDAKSVNLSEIDFPSQMKLLQWVKVKIIVDGNQVDVFLNDTQALHYLIDSFGLTIEKSYSFKDDAGKEFQGKTSEVIPFGSFSAGRIGFRCGDTEHAHFRNVKVKPL